MWLARVRLYTKPTIERCGQPLKDAWSHLITRRCKVHLRWCASRYFSTIDDGGECVIARLNGVVPVVQCG